MVLSLVWSYFWPHISEIGNDSTSLLLLIMLLMLLLLLPRIIQSSWQRSVVKSVSRDFEFAHLPLPPGSLGYPVVGETISFLKYGASFYKRKMDEHGNIYKTHLLGNPTIRVIGAENLRKILLSEETLVTQVWPLSTRLLLGAGSISQSTGQVHKLRRRHMLRTFNHEAFSSFVPIIQATIRTNLDRWRQVTDFKAYPECKRMTFETAARTLFGLDQESASKHRMHRTFCELTENLMSIPVNLPGFGFRKGIQAKKKLISDIRELLPEIKEHHFSLIHNETYPKAHQNSDEDIEYYEGLIDILFAGHETVSSTTTNIMMFLGQNKHVVDKIREELRAHGLLDDTDNITFAAVNDLKYTAHVIKEVLRLCPPVGGGFRKVLKSFELGGFLIPKDWTVIYSIRETQHTSAVFPENEKFDPDRWKLIEEVNKTCPVNVERFHYTPFGYGQRGCVGQVFSKLVMKIFLVELVRTFDWTLKNENPVLRYIPTPIAIDHLPLTLHHRSNNNDIQKYNNKR